MMVRVAQLFHQILRPMTRLGKLRDFWAILGVVALCLQSFAPTMAQAADLEWMVICSDDGAKLVQVDLSEGQNHEPCPDCDDCALCATGSESADPAATTMVTTHGLAAPQTSIRTVPILWNADYLWPVTRGPPSANNDKKDRVFRAFPVSNSKKGEAL